MNISLYRPTNSRSHISASSRCHATETSAKASCSALPGSGARSLLVYCNAFLTYFSASASCIGCLLLRYMSLRSGGPETLDKDWIEFSALVAAWKAETIYSSSLRIVFASASYQRILAIPPDKLGPLIIRQLITEGPAPYHWWPALHTVTRDDPVGRRQIGDVKAMAKAWIEWGRRRYGEKLGSDWVS